MQFCEGKILYQNFKKKITALKTYRKVYFCEFAVEISIFPLKNSSV